MKQWWIRLGLMGLFVFTQTFLVTGFVWAWGLGIVVPAWKMVVVSALYAAVMVLQNWLFNRPRLIKVPVKKGGLA